MSGQALLDFDFYPAKPARDEIINGCTDNSKKEAKNRVDDRHKKPKPKHYAGSEGCRRRVLILLGMLRKSSRRASKRKEGQEEQSHASVEDA